LEEVVTVGEAVTSPSRSGEDLTIGIIALTTIADARIATRGANLGLIVWMTFPITVELLTDW